MLSEVKKLLEERSAMSLKEIALHFQMDVDAAEGMLEVLERKGRIKRVSTTCSSCKGCAEVKREEAILFRVV